MIVGGLKDGGTVKVNTVQSDRPDPLTRGNVVYEGSWHLEKGQVVVHELEVTEVDYRELRASYLELGWCATSIKGQQLPQGVLQRSYS